MFAVSRLRTVAACLAGRTRAATTSRQLVPKRQSSGDAWFYREPNLNVPRYVTVSAEVLMASMWYWILWHLWYDWHHIVGTPLPDPSKWTDEELGIPPDSED